MATYDVRHLNSNKVFTRPEVYIHRPTHDALKDRDWKATQAEASIEAFHKSMPDYAETRLHTLPSVASELGLSHVFVKDESTRLGLPAFKILGASWAIHRVVCERLQLPVTSTLDEVRQKLKPYLLSGNDLRFVTCTEGNWGRACARMAKYLEVPITIYVPGFMHEYTRNLIRGEGAKLTVLEGASYDDSVAAAKEDMETTGSVLVLDVSWDGYEQFPLWVTDGYRTMLSETDRQVAALTNGLQPNTFFVAVGAASWAHAVVSHYKALDTQTMTVSVEPDTAASLKESLHCDQLTPIETGETIMAGMNCGTISKCAWPVLRDGIHAAVTVNDKQSHQSVQYLQGQGVNVGPCGAATLAALRKFVNDVDAETRQGMIVVLFSTEGWREYETPV